MCGELRTTETYDTCILNLCNDLLRLKRTLALMIRSAVDSLEPLIALTLDDNHHAALTLTIGKHIYIGHSTRYGRVDICRHETCRLSDNLTYEHLIALLHYGCCGSTDMLHHGQLHLIGKLQDLDSLILAPLFIVMRMNTAYWECSHTQFTI